MDSWPLLPSPTFLPHPLSVVLFCPGGISIPFYSLPLRRCPSSTSGSWSRLCAHYFTSSPHRRSPIYKHISSLVFSDFPKMLGSSSRLVLLQISAIVLGIATAAPISIRDDMTITKDALARVLLSQPTTITFTDTVKT